MLLPLSLTGFFETYDVALLTLGAPVLAQGLGLSIATFAFGVALIRLASLGSIPVLRLADRWGRRTLLFVSLGVFTVVTGMTALATGFVMFVALQMVARVFLATESTLAGLVIAEEFRPDRRGSGLSVLGVVSGAGFGAVGGMMLVVPLTSLGWRLFYLLSLFPLAIVIYLRRNLRETHAFEAARAQHRVQNTFWPRVAPRHRRTLATAVTLVSTFGFVHTAAFFYASDVAQNDFGWNGLFTVLVISAGVFGIAGFAAGGRLSDRVGRRPIVALAIVLASAGTILMFTGHRLLFILGFFLSAAAGACFVTVTLAYVAELFPTEVRATLSSVVISCQVAGGSIGLAAVGGISHAADPALTMMIMGGALLTSLLLLRRLPETRGRDLIVEPPFDEPDAVRDSSDGPRVAPQPSPA